MVIKNFDIERSKGSKVTEKCTEEDTVEEQTEPDDITIIESSDDESVDIYNMKESAKRVSTPGIPDLSTLVYGNGNNKTSPELKQQRDLETKKRKESSKKVQSDILSVNKGINKGIGKKKKRARQENILRL